MWKLLAVSAVTAFLALGPAPALSSPAPGIGLSPDLATGMTLASHRGHSYGGHRDYYYRRNHHGDNYRHHRDYYPRYSNHHHHHNYYSYYPRYSYYPNYRNYYYGPGFGWNYCGWDMGYPYGCYGYGSGFYGGFGGFYGDLYYPRRHAAYSHNSRHVAWCKSRYRTYNVRSDTFIGRGNKRYRCRSPYHN